MGRGHMAWSVAGEGHDCHNAGKLLASHPPASARASLRQEVSLRPRQLFHRNAADTLPPDPRLPRPRGFARPCVVEAQFLLAPPFLLPDRRLKPDFSSARHAAAKCLAGAAHAACRCSSAHTVRSLDMAMEPYIRQGRKAQGQHMETIGSHQVRPRQHGAPQPGKPFRAARVRHCRSTREQHNPIAALQAHRERRAGLKRCRKRLQHERAGRDVGPQVSGRKH